MKAAIIIPTVQYGNVTYEFEGEPEEALAFSAKMNELVKNPPAVGLPRKEFRAFIDRQLRGEGNDVEELIQMNQIQQAVAQEIKLAIKRASYGQSDSE